MLINGLVIARFRLPPFIATLGMFTIIAAAARLYSQSQSFPVTSDLLSVLGSGPEFGAVAVTYGTMLWVALTLVLGYALNETAWGVRVYAIGNSPVAARLNGVNVTRVVFSAYALAGVFYAFAAWQALGRDEKQLPLIGLSRHVVVGDTDKEAQSAAKRAFALWYDALIHLWRAHGVGLPRQMIPAEFEPALEGGYIVAGSPATVRERLKRDNDIAGINYCICRLAFGDLTFEESKRSVELLAKEVMPAL